ncbi:MAG: hypothetical protein AAGL89_17840 [Pseudomonadota bacterium]
MARDFKTHRKNARAALRVKEGRGNIDELSFRQALMFAHLTKAELEELALIGTGELA